MIKKYILAVVAIVLAVWVGFFFGKKAAVAPNAPVESTAEVSKDTVIPSTQKTTSVTQTTTPKKTTTSAPAMTKEGYYLVSYSNNGFVPGILTINVGKSVRFVNNSSKAMSLVSIDPDSHVYGEFNQGKTVGSGGIYDFTFLTAGTWGYINRNNPSDRGTIIVQ